MVRPRDPAWTAMLGLIPRAVAGQHGAGWAFATVPEDLASSMGVSAAVGGWWEAGPHGLLGLPTAAL